MNSHEIAMLRRDPSVDPASLFRQQLDAMGARFEEALQAHDDGWAAISATARDLCRLGGERSSASFDVAAMVLRSMRFLGTRLDQELPDVRERRRQPGAADVVGA